MDSQTFQTGQMSVTVLATGDLQDCKVVLNFKCVANIYSTNYNSQGRATEQLVAHKRPLTH